MFLVATASDMIKQTWLLVWPTEHRCFPTGCRRRLSFLFRIVLLEGTTADWDLITLMFSPETGRKLVDKGHNLMI